MLVRSYKKVVPYRLQEGDAEGSYVRPLITEEDGVNDFHMLLLRVDPGGCTPTKKYPYSQQMFVRKGDGEVHHESDRREVSEGDVILTREEEEFQIRNSSDERDLEMLIIKPASEEEPFDTENSRVEEEEDPSSEST